jgi:hypothetical protein
MTRESDFYFKIPAGDCSLWGANQCKPVLIFLCLPFTIAGPNFEVQQRLLEDCHRSMLKEGLWKGSGKRGGGYFAPTTHSSEGSLRLVREFGVGNVSLLWVIKLSLDNAQLTTTE